MRGLSADARARVSARQGVDRCLVDVGSGADAPFLSWARTRMGSRAVYALAQQSAYPDRSCLALALLPALPAGPGDRRPGWEIAIGGFSPRLDSLIASRDPNVHVFGPGLALVRLKPG